MLNHINSCAVDKAREPSAISSTPSKSSSDYICIWKPARWSYLVFCVSTQLPGLKFIIQINSHYEIIVSPAYIYQCNITQWCAVFDSFSYMPLKECHLICPFTRCFFIMVWRMFYLILLVDHLYITNILVIWWAVSVFLCHQVFFDIFMGVDQYYCMVYAYFRVCVVWVSWWSLDWVIFSGI